MANLPRSPKIEVEYALILSQMIDVAEADPSQLRVSIYEFARKKLKYNTLATEKSERERLSAALEAAIDGVEKFSRRRDEWRRLEGASLSNNHRAVAPSFLTEKPRPVQLFPGAFVEGTFGLRERVRSLRPLLTLTKQDARDLARNWFAVGVVAFTVLSVLALVTVILFSRRPDLRSTVSPFSAAVDAGTSVNAKDFVRASPPGSTSPAPPSPLPTDFGVYAVNGSSLSELEALPGQLPDSRIPMYAPISLPSRTELANGVPQFVVFRRDLAGIAADRFEVRAVARVARVLAFDPKGKIKISSAVPANWIIRNISYDFKARPVDGHPEMLLLQLRIPGATLPAGRYVLALKDKGYDFTVPGTPSDPAQCVERTDALNGSFYSDCTEQGATQGQKGQSTGELGRLENSPRVMAPMK